MRPVHPTGRCLDQTARIVEHHQLMLALIGAAMQRKPSTRERNGNDGGFELRHRDVVQSSLATHDAAPIVTATGSKVPRLPMLITGSRLARAWKPANRPPKTYTSSPAVMVSICPLIGFGAVMTEPGKYS